MPLHKDFKTNLDFQRGDLLYGISGARGKYLMEAFPGNWGHTFWGYIDDYNNQFFCPVLGQMNPAAIKKSIDELSTHVLKNFKEISSTKHQIYVQKLWQHEKYSPKKTLNMNPINVLRKEGLLEIVIELQRELNILKKIKKPNSNQQVEQQRLKTKIRSIVKKAYERKAIRRGCKFGLQMICKQLNSKLPDAQVHFLLDGMTMDDVIDKKTVTYNDVLGRDYEYVYITNTELRSVYRYWKSFNHAKINFYLNGENVGAPWENEWTNKKDVFGVERTNTIAAWNRYIPKSWPKPTKKTEPMTEIRKI